MTKRRISSIARVGRSRSGFGLALGVGLGLTLLAGAVWSQTASTGAALRLDAYRADLRTRFANVEHVTTDELARMSPASMLLIDVRERKEYAVSRIPGALHVEDTGALLELARAHPDTRIVLYCSVGVRSSRAAQRLMARGVQRVANLDGSIFQWSNEGRPLEDGNGPTRRVHPYNRYWGNEYLEPPRSAQAAPNRSR